MLSKCIFPEQSKIKANDFVMGVASEKWRLCSSRWLPWSSRTGWQVVSTTILNDFWIFDWRCDAWQIHLSRSIKTKANDFVTGVANKKQCLHSSQWLPWSSRTGQQVVSTTIFKWLLNLWLKMWCLANLTFQSNQNKGKWLCDRSSQWETMFAF